MPYNSDPRVLNKKHNCNQRNCRWTLILSISLHSQQKYSLKLRCLWFESKLLIHQCTVCVWSCKTFQMIMLMTVVTVTAFSLPGYHNHFATSTVTHNVQSMRIFRVSKVVNITILCTVVTILLLGDSSSYVPWSFRLWHGSPVFWGESGLT